MKKKALYLILVGLAQFLLLGHFAPAVAQGDYPNRPIEIIIPWPAGPTADLATRFFAEKLPEFLGQPVVPVNKPGGGGALGTKFVAGAKPDGYTLLAGGNSALITARFELKGGGGYDLDSFQQICQWSKLASYFSVKADSKWKTMKEVLLDAKQNPEKLRYSSLRGAVAHYAGEMLFNTAGVKLTFVPFKSSVECMTALIGGHVELAVSTGLVGMSGSPLIRPLAVADDERLFDHPDVPTLKEVGYPISMYSIVVLCGPKGIPKAVVNRLYEANRKVFEKYGDEIKAKLPKMDQYPAFADGESVSRMVREAEKKYRGLAPQMGIKLE